MDKQTNIWLNWDNKKYLCIGKKNNYRLRDKLAKVLYNFTKKYLQHIIGIGYYAQYTFF